MSLNLRKFYAAITALWLFANNSNVDAAGKVWNELTSTAFDAREFHTLAMRLVLEFSTHIPTFPHTDTDRDGCLTAFEFANGMDSLQMYLRRVANHYEAIQNLTFAPAESAK
eukprot:gene7604-9056_t